MKQNKQQNLKRGFTLLELLVVVVIIGILAAIALPQYRMAVLKSRFATTKQNAKTLFYANQRYYMINNQYTTNTNDLDIQITSGDRESYYLLDTGTILSRIKFGSNGGVEYRISNKYILCHFYSDDAKEMKILDDFCKKETNKNQRGCNSETDCYYFY